MVKSSHAKSLLALYGLITFGFSRFFLAVNTGPGQFPKNALFITWFIVWIQLVPLIILYGVEFLFLRTGKDRLFKLWRAALYAGVSVLLLRQFQVFEHETYSKFLWFISFTWIALATSLIVFLTSYRYSVIFDTYARFLGICSLAFPTVFLVDCLRPPSSHPGFPSSHARIKSPGPPIIFVIFDELSLKVLAPNGSIETSSFPNFARLSRQAIWFRMATTNHWNTLDSIPSMLTGSIEHTEAPDLFQLLPEDYNSAAVLSEIEVENWLRSRPRAAKIQYAGKASFLTKDPLTLADYLLLQFVSLLQHDSSYEMMADSAAYHLTLQTEIEQFKQLLRQPAPFVVWHISVPHSPFIFLPDGKRSGNKLSGFQYEEDYRVSSFPVILANYRIQVQYADSLMGIILNDLKEAGIERKAVLIVTSDHGLRVWGDYIHNPDLVSQVPVFMSFPGEKPRIVDSDFQLVDIVPTLMDHLGYPVPNNIDGVSAFSSKPAARPKIVHFHPEKLAYDAKTGAWFLDDNQQTPEARFVTVIQAKRGFSAMQVWDDMLVSRSDHKPFLTVYLNKHFPTTTTDSDLDELQKNIMSLKRLPDAPNKFFRLGIDYFFLALAQSQRASQGKEIDLTKVNQDWNNSILYLEKAPEIASSLREEIARLVDSNDFNNDGRLDTAELSTMIRSHTAGR